MKSLLVILLLLISGNVFAQSISSNGSPEIYLFNNAQYSIRLEVIEKFKFKYILDDKTTEKDRDTTFIIINNDYEPFKMALKNVLIKKKMPIPAITSEDTVQLNKEFDRVYFFFQATEMLASNLSFKPEAGKVCLTDHVIIDEITTSDKIVKKIARAKRKTFKVAGKNFYHYQGRYYKKRELEEKIIKDTLNYFADFTQNKYDTADLPAYKAFLNKYDSVIRAHEKSKSALSEAQKKLEHLVDTRGKKEMEVGENLDAYQVYARKYKSQVSAAGFDNELPKIDSPDYNAEKSNYRTEMRGKIALDKQEIERLDRETKKIVDLLKKNPIVNTDSLKIKELGMKDELKENEERKRVLESSVERDFETLVLLAEKWRKTKTELDGLDTEKKSLVDSVKDKEKMLSNHNVAIKTLYAEQQKHLDNLRRILAASTQLSFKVEKVDIEFNNGFIENILVLGETTPGKVKYYNRNLQERDTSLTKTQGQIKFENRHPIGFSRKRDFENLKRKHLFTIDGNLPKYKLHLEDLLRMYEQRHEIDRRDFCPADTVLRISFDSKETSRYCHTLYKEANYKILEAKVFSDFAGLDRTNPNGLIQIEIDKRISLITDRHPVTLYRYEIWNVGFLNYITPTLTLSKVEENNKNLPVAYRDEIVNGEFFPSKYTSTLELKRHENFSVGFDLNVALLDIPAFKSTFYLDYGFRYGRVAIVDSLRDYQANTQSSVKNGRVENYGVNTLQFYPRIHWLVRSDERYSFNFSGSVNWYFLRSNAFNQVANEEVFADFGNAGNARRVFANVTMLATLKPNVTAKGKLFFRYQYNWQFNYANTGFHQAQVGYTFYLFSNKG